MFQTIWFFLKLSFIVVGAIWLLSLPGNIVISFLGYGLNINIGLFLLSLIILFFIAVLLIQTLSNIISLPLFFKRKKEKRNWQNSYTAITQSITAASLGDSKTMGKMARKAYTLLPIKNSLPLFLEAQANYLGEETAQAQKKFEKLLIDKETMPLGLQGLLKTALDHKEYKKALYFSEKTFHLYPKKPWILQTYYKLLLKNEQYQDAINIGVKAVKHKALDPEHYKNDKAAIYYTLATKDQIDNTLSKQSILYLKQALNTDPAFTPAIIALAEYYIANNQISKAVSCIKKGWQMRPHPELAKIWEELSFSAQEKPKKYIKWFKNLAALNPHDFETHMLMAQAHIKCNEHGEAQQHIDRAWDIYPSAYCLKIRQEINAALPTEVTAPDKVWMCIETGLIYEQWSSIAEPHNSFNTIRWSIPNNIQFAPETIKQTAFLQTF